MRFFRTRKDRTLANEQESVEKLRASIEEKLANYNPDEDDSTTTFSTLPLPTCPVATTRDIRSRIVVEDPEADRMKNRDVQLEHIRTRGTDQVGECEDMSNLIAPIPEESGKFEVSWMDVGEEGVETVRETTKRFWAGEKSNWR